MKLTPLIVCATISIGIFPLHADTIVLDSGETLQVNIIRIEGQSLIATHSILGDMNIPLEHIEFYEFDQTTQSNPPELNPVPIQDAKRQGVDSKWDHTLHIGLGYLHSQHDNLDINASYHGVKQTVEHQVTFDVGYRFSESDHNRTTNWLSSSLGNSWEQPNIPWDFFTTVQIDWSEFQSWDQRVIGDVGIKFELLQVEVDDELFLLEGRIGAGVRKEFGSHNDGFVPEGLLGISCDWNIGDSQTIHADSTWFPDFNDSQHYRIVTNASWNIKLENLENLSFAIGLHHEFDSNVDVGVENAFLQVTAGINYSF